MENDGHLEIYALRCMHVLWMDIWLDGWMDAFKLCARRWMYGWRWMLRNVWVDGRLVVDGER